MAHSDTPVGQREATGPSLTALRVAAVVAAMLIVSTGPDLLLTLNCVLGRGPSRPFAGVVSGKYARKSGRRLTLKGAPLLPTPDNAMDVNVSVREYDAPVGDSVFVDLKPGLFGRPCIVSYRVQTAQDRVQEVLNRHRARVRARPSR
jgi:hypothetical protein